MIRYLTAGESHNKELISIIDNIPSGIELSENDINKELARRQVGYGRGARMKIEKDNAEIISGVRGGKTTGSPIAIKIKNKDWENWKLKSYEDTRESIPRPGHADLSGVLKYNLNNIRDVLERSSARETASRVAVGAVAKKVLHYLNIKFYSVVFNIGGISYKIDDIEEIIDKYEEIESSDLRCLNEEFYNEAKALIDNIKKEKDTIGGIFKVIIRGVPVGIGDFTQWDRKLDANLARAILSIQGIKGIEFGEGFNIANKKGSEIHDEIFYSPEKGYFRKSNNAGGIEGGMSNGEDIVFNAIMKPIPTLMQPLKSVDIITKEEKDAIKERSDVSVVPAAAVIAENVSAIEILKFIQLKFGGDSIEEIKNNIDGYLKLIRK